MCLRQSELSCILLPISQTISSTYAIKNILFRFSLHRIDKPVILMEDNPTVILSNVQFRASGAEAPQPLIRPNGGVLKMNDVLFVDFKVSNGLIQLEVCQDSELNHALHSLMVLHLELSLITMK